MRQLLAPLALAAGLCCAAPGAQAASPSLYYGLGFSDGNLDVPGDGDRSLGTLSLTLGVRLLPFLGVELGAGVASDDAGSILSEPLVNYQAAMVRLGWRWDRVGVYALAGQSRLDVDDDVRANIDAANVVGLGINLYGNEHTAVNAHVLRFGDQEFTTATVGFQYYFGGYR